MGIEAAHGTAADVPERWEFRVGAIVAATDANLGTLRRVVVNPGDEQVRAIIVRAGVLPPHDLLIPLEAVTQAADDEVRLAWTQAECRRLGAFDPAALLTPDRVIAGYAPGEAAVTLHGSPRGEERQSGEGPRRLPAIQVGLQVEALDGPAGHVRQVLVDSATGRATHFVIRESRLMARDRLVPIEWLWTADGNLVRVDATLSDLACLPEYRPDGEVRRAVRDAFRQDELASEMLELCPMGLHVQDGVATLCGYVTTPEDQRYLENVVREVPGVLFVRNELRTDPQVEKAVAAALSADPITAGLSIQPDSFLGKVRLHGEAPSTEIRQVVAEVAAGAPGVRSVVNMVRVPGCEAPGETDAGIEAHPDQRVRTLDGAFGHVYKVIVSPGRRQVTDLLVAGNLPTPSPDYPGVPPSEWPRPHRAVIIPAGWVSSAVEEVVLHVGTAEASAAPTYDRERYVDPDPEWIPPYPFEHREIVIDTHRPEGGSASYVEANAGAVPVPEPERERYTALAGRAATPEGLPVVARGEPVCARTGEIGSIGNVLIDPATDLATHLVVLAGVAFEHDKAVPVDWVRSVSPDGVFVDAGARMLDALPDYRRDSSSGKRRAAA